MNSPSHRPRRIDSPQSARADTDPRRRDTEDLVEQILDLHEMADQRANTASPLGRELIAIGRNGTYHRLAHVIAAADPDWAGRQHSTEPQEPATPPPVRAPTADDRTVAPAASGSDRRSPSPDADDRAPTIRRMLGRLQIRRRRAQRE